MSHVPESETTPMIPNNSSKRREERPYDRGGSVSRSFALAVMKHWARIRGGWCGARTLGRRVGGPAVTAVLFCWALVALSANWCHGAEATSRGAKPLPLSAVRLTGGPLKRAQDLNAEYLLKLEPDRMLAYYRERAGLEPKAKPYGGWDGGGRNLTGHIGGHYLSAASLMWAATGDR